MTRVFVYGSLMSAQPNHRYLARARFVRVARTERQFTLLSLGAYPALLRGGDTSVRGELYDVDDVTLAALDRLEGHPTLYRRELVALRGTQNVFAYVLASSRGAAHDAIKTGDWRMQCASKS